jgi:hypothetical protein
MAFVEMSCGKCDSSFQLEIEENDSLPLLWANQFMSAHSECGFMSPSYKDVTESTTFINILDTEEKPRKDAL